MYTQTGKALSDSIAHRDSEGLRLSATWKTRFSNAESETRKGPIKSRRHTRSWATRASALRMLRYSIEHGFFAWPYFTTDPLLSNLRNEPQFSELMALARNKYTAFRKNFF